MTNSNGNVIDVNGGKLRKTITAVVIILVIAFLVFNSFTVVSAGHSGVVVTLGEVSDNVLQEGLHFKIPFIQQIVLMDNRVKKAEVSDASSASKDLQTVTSTIVVNYKVLNSYSASVYKNIGMDYESVIITPAVVECVKAVTAKFTAEELITNRQSVSDQMMELLRAKIGNYGIDIQIFNITGFEFTAEYNAAIEAKQTAQQNALKAEQDLQRIRVEAEQTITQAEAEAEAYRLKSEKITPEILISNYIEKWDGKLPTVVSGEGGTMMIDLTALLEQISGKGTSSGGAAYGYTGYVPAQGSNTVSETNTDME